MAVSESKQLQATTGSAVLFAIGNEPIRRLLAAVLAQRTESYNYHIVATLEDARQWLEHSTPKCVVMTVDIALGVAVDGIGLLGDLPTTMPVVSLLEDSPYFPLYPAYIYQYSRWRDYNTTPFHVDELLNRIESVISRAPGVQEHNISNSSFGDISEHLDA